jgi:hypothetical protein
MFGTVMSYIAIRHFLKAPDDLPILYFGLFCFAQYIFISTLTNISIVFNAVTRKELPKEKNMENK